MNSDQQKVMDWLFSGDTGISSKALAACFLGSAPAGRFENSPPLDPADLGRCLRLIEKVPAVRACVDTLAEKHDGWARLAPVWDDLAKSMEDEVGIHWNKGRSAPITYDLMQKHRKFGQ